MPTKKRKTARMDLFEWLIRRTGRFVCIHDGTKNAEQAKIPPSELACYTRKYQLKIDNELVNTFITFKYDTRERPPLVSMEISYRDGKSHGRQKLLKQITEEELQPERSV